MRCLVVADLHYSLPQLDWLVSAAPQFDLVIFAGDMRSTSARWWIFARRSWW
ncbi:putative phosphodiesterase [Bradyrhizobium sp. i1.3.1]